MTVESAGNPDCDQQRRRAGPDAIDARHAQNVLVLQIAHCLLKAFRGGVKYLDWLMGEFENDPILVLAGYNAGEGSVRKYSGVPPFRRDT